MMTTMRKNIATNAVDSKYAIQTVYFWDVENTWEQVQNGECEVIEITLHSGYRVAGKTMVIGERMYMPLGEYDECKEAKKMFDWACRIVTQENEKYTTEIKVNQMGNPVVIHNSKEA